MIAEGSHILLYGSMFYGLAAWTAYPRCNAMSLLFCSILSVVWVVRSANFFPFLNLRRFPVTDDINLKCIPTDLGQEVLAREN